jgi:hypothetical protein
MLYNKTIISLKGTHQFSKRIYMVITVTHQILKAINKTNPFFMKYKNNSNFLIVIKLIREYSKVHRQVLEDNNLVN